LKEKNVSFDPSIDTKHNIPKLHNLNNLETFKEINASVNCNKMSANSMTNQFSHRSNLPSYRSDMSLDVNQPNMVAN